MAAFTGQTPAVVSLSSQVEMRQGKKERKKERRERMTYRDGEWSNEGERGRRKMREKK